jgi:hypothetical protein
LDAIAASGALPAGGPRIQGGAWCSPHWLASFADYADTFMGKFSSISYHTYSESVCHGDHATLGRLLANNVTEKLVTMLTPLQAATVAARTPFFIGEGNSVSCGGAAGVSDVFGAALWAVDALFTIAHVGLQRWYFHGMPNGPYSAIAFPDVSSETPNVRPLFYGLLAFSSAVARAGAQLRVVDTISRTNDLVRAWCVEGAAASGGGARELRFVVMHKDLAATSNATITLTAPGAQGAGLLVRLLSGPKGMLAQWDDGITWQGQTWSASTNGEPAGAPVSESVQAGAGGDFVFSLPPASLAMITLAL